MAVDTAAGADAAHAPAQPGKWRLGGALWLLGMPGVVAVVWALLPTLKVNEAIGLTTSKDVLEALGVKVEKTHVVTDKWGATNVPGIWAIGDLAGAPWLAHYSASKFAVVGFTQALARPELARLLTEADRLGVKLPAAFPPKNSPSSTDPV